MFNKICQVVQPVPVVHSRLYSVYNKIKFSYLTRCCVLICQGERTFDFCDAFLVADIFSVSLKWILFLLCECRLNNVFIIGKGNKPWVSLPRGKGVRLSIAEERDRRIQAKAQ